MRQVAIQLPGTGMQGQFGERGDSEEFGDRLTGNPQASRNLVGRDPLLGERDNLLEVLFTGNVPVLSAPDVSRCGVFGRAENRIDWGTAPCRLPQTGVVPRQTALHDLSRVHAQMKPVGDLFGLRCP